MQQDRYCVYEYSDGDNADEVSWHYTFDKAVAVATKLHEATGLRYRIDLNICEVSRSGVENIGTEPDLWGIERG